MPNFNVKLKTAIEPKLVSWDSYSCRCMDSMREWVL